MTERIQGPGSKTEDKKTSVPDARYFKELYVEKPSEVELEEQKKPKLGLSEEEEEEASKEKTSASPYEPTFYEEKETKENVPTSSKVYHQVDLPGEKLVKKPKKKTAFSKTKEFSELKPKEPRLAPLDLFETKEKPITSKGEISEKLRPEKMISKKDAKEKEKSPLEKEGFEKAPKETFSLASYAFTQPVESKVGLMTTKVEQYLSLHPDMPLLFHDIAGTIVVMQTRNLTSTELILNSTPYQNSALFGARILIEKYSSAPDSFNIRLIGNTQAVELFNRYLPSLETAFIQGTYDFHVHLLRVEHEEIRPLFHRKTLDEEKEKDEGS